MLRTLLAERFKLAIHKETRELPIYALVLARTDGTVGPRLRPASPDCATATAQANGDLAKLKVQMGCALTMSSPGELTGKDLPLAQLAGVLAGFLQRTVIDRTGLSGHYAVALSWTPDQIQLSGLATDSNGPSLFTALQEQLGLKLESTKGPVDVFAIDHVEHPTED